MATWTQAQYDALAAAISAGVLSVRYDGPPARSVTYASAAEMRETLAMMARDLGLSTTPTVAYASFSRGV